MNAITPASLVALFAVAGCFRGAAPTPQDPGLVTLDAALGHREILADTGGEVLARFVVTAGAAPATERPPLNLAIVVDTSGSMAGDPIDQARDACLAMVDRMRDGDFLSVVAFHSTTEVLLPATEVRRGDLDELRGRIAAMEAGGTTDLAGGLREGLSQVLAHRSGETLDRVVLLGDGVPNDPAPLTALAQQAGNAHVPVAVLGLGLDYDETLMGQIAQLSHGHFEYVRQPDQVARVFQDQIVAADRLVARGAVLQLQPGPGVEIEEVVGQNTPNGAGGLALTIGDLSENDSREFVVRLRAPGRRAGALVELVDARLTFVDAVAEAGALSRAAFLGARATADPQRQEASRDPEVHEAAAALRAAETTLAAIRMVRTGQVREAAAALRAAEAMLPDGRSSRQAASIRRMRRVVESTTATAAPSAPSADFEDSVRQAHEESLDALGY